MIQKIKNWFNNSSTNNSSSIQDDLVNEYHYLTNKINALNSVYQITNDDALLDGISMYKKLRKNIYTKFKFNNNRTLQILYYKDHKIFIEGNKIKIKNLIANNIEYDKNLKKLTFNINNNCYFIDSSVKSANNPILIEKFTEMKMLYDYLITF